MQRCALLLRCALRDRRNGMAVTARLRAVLAKRSSPRPPSCCPHADHSLPSLQDYIFSSKQTGSSAKMTTIIKVKHSGKARVACLEHVAPCAAGAEPRVGQGRRWRAHSDTLICVLLGLCGHFEPCFGACQACVDVWTASRPLGGHG